MTLHLYEFESSGYYAAPTREEAFEKVIQNSGFDREEAEEDFLRDVPDDEVIRATAEEPWEHSGELREYREIGGRTVSFYHLELTALEHAALSSEWGYCFGGEQ